MLEVLCPAQMSLPSPSSSRCLFTGTAILFSMGQGTISATGQGCFSSLQNISSSSLKHSCWDSLSSVWFHSNYLDFKFGFLGCGSQDQKRSASNPVLQSANRVMFERKQLCVVTSDLRTRYESSSYQVQCCAWGLEET